MLDRINAGDQHQTTTQSTLVRPAKCGCGMTSCWSPIGCMRLRLCDVWRGGGMTGQRLVCRTTAAVVSFAERLGAVVCRDHYIPYGGGDGKRERDTGWTHDPLTPTHTFHTLAHLEIQRLVSKTSRWNKSIVYLYIREIEMQKLIKRLNAWTKKRKEIKKNWTGNN